MVEHTENMEYPNYVTSEICYLTVLKHWVTTQIWVTFSTNFEWIAQNHNYILPFTHQHTSWQHYLANL